MFIKILLSNVTFQLPEYQTNKIKKIFKKKDTRNIDNWSLFCVSAL